MLEKLVTLWVTDSLNLSFGDQTVSPSSGYLVVVSISRLWFSAQKKPKCYNKSETARIYTPKYLKFLLTCFQSLAHNPKDIGCSYFASFF